ncbi:MAG TPA: SRPBCC family protein [Rubrobacter sp.]|nr:SRPBCC family protein [Rubrobacter sp.]
MAQRVRESIEVEAPVEDIFRYWSNFQNFSSFMSNVEEVRLTAQDTSHWRVKGPLGKSVEFDAKTTELNPNRGIGWNTVDGDVMTSGEVRFEEVSPGRTQVEVTMNYADPPGGAVGEVIANALSNPERILREDLENFARIVERGELGGPKAQSLNTESHL